jgi:hypothetical protein
MSKLKAAKNKAKEIGKGMLSVQTWKKSFKETPSNWSETLSQTLVDGTFGIAGGVAGNFMGVWGVLGALPLNIWANKSGHRWLRAASIAMLASGFEEAVNSRTADAGFDLKNEVSDGKERVKKYLGQMKRKFGLDKVFGSKPPAQTTTDTPTVNGLGTTIDALDKFEHQITSSAIEHEGGAPPTNQNSSSETMDKSNLVEAFTVSGLDDLDTPHVI